MDPESLFDERASPSSIVRKENTDAFLSAIARTPELWHSFHFRAVALWVEGGWHNLVASVHLDRRSPEQIASTQDLPCLDRLVVLQEVFPVTELPDILRRIRLRGSVSLAGRVVHFRGARGYTDRFGQPYGNSYHRCGLSLGDYIRGDFIRGHALVAFGESGADLLREFPDEQNGIDVTLRRAGWQSLDELVLRGLEDVMAVPVTSSARIAFIAPIEAAIVEEACTLRAGQLHYAVRAGSREAGRRGTLTITGEDHQGGRVARMLPLDTKRWTKDGRGYRHSGRVRLPNAQKLHLTLQVAGYELAELKLSDQGDLPETPPLLMLAHDALFSGERSFRDLLLDPRSNEGRQFERAVAKLFIYCGFPTDHPGRVPEEQKGPDVLVEVPSRNLLLVIEATVKHLMNDDGKMNRLTKRSADIRFGIKPVNVEVLPVMVVPWARETMVPVEMAEAEKNGVRVLCREDLAALLEMALAHRSPRKIANSIIPEAAGPRRRGLAMLVERNPLAE